MSCIRLMVFLCCLTFTASRGDCEEYQSAFEGHFKEYGESVDRILDLVGKFMPRKPTIFEAGGHWGTDTTILAKKWPKGTLITFEPNPHAFEILSGATQGLTNVRKYNLAVNNYNGTAVLYVCHGSNGDNPDFEGASSLLESSDWMRGNYQGPKVEVPCVVLDDWCRKNKIPNIDFMWLDLEGLELQVLKSSPKILKTVKVIYTETNFREFRKGMTSYENLKKFLEKSGFKLLSHWYWVNFQGNAIFVKKELYPLAFAK